MGKKDYGILNERGYKDMETVFIVCIVIIGVVAVTYLVTPEFDTKNNKKVSEALILLACGTFPNFAVTRYFSCLLVSAQIFFIFLTGTISLDVQKPNAS